MCCKIICGPSTACQVKFADHDVNILFTCLQLFQLLNMFLQLSQLVVISTKKRLALRIPIWSFAALTVFQQFTGGFGPPRHEKCIYGGRVQSKSSDFSAFFFAEKHVETIIEANWGGFGGFGGFGGLWIVCFTISFPSPLTVHMAFFIGFKKTGPWQGSSWKFLPLSAGLLRPQVIYISDRVLIGLFLRFLLLMEGILHQLIGSLSHYLQGFIHSRWCRMQDSAINSSKRQVWWWNLHDLQQSPEVVEMLVMLGNSRILIDLNRFFMLGFFQVRDFFIEGFLFYKHVFDLYQGII